MKPTIPRHRIFCIRSDVYPMKVIFCVGPNPSVSLMGSLCRRHGIWNGKGTLTVPSEGMGACHTFYGGSFIWLRHRPHSPETFSTFIHEIMHAVINTSKTIGQYPTFEADELHAYLAGWIAKRFMQDIGKTRSLRK